MIPDLSNADWVRDPRTQKILAALDGEQQDGGQIRARCVGGCVRNYLLGKAVADIDIATSHPPPIAKRLLYQAGFSVYDTGLAHGTITAHAHNMSFEVTTLRKDVRTDGRHADVVFTDDWSADAARRDFYLNAVYVDRFGRVFDPTGMGLAHIQARTVQFIGDADARISEDYLRILRFFRFSAFYAETFDQAGLTACAKNMSGLTVISGERIWSELEKMFSAPNFLTGVAFAKKAGLLKACLPNFQTTALNTLPNIEAAMGTGCDAAFRIWVGCVADPDFDPNFIRDRYKISNTDFERLKTLVALRREASGVDIAHLAYYHGVDAVRDYVIMACVDTQTLPDPDIMMFLRNYVRPIFPINGHDLLGKGYSGASLGVALKTLETDWVGSDFRTTRTALLAKLPSKP